MGIDYGPNSEIIPRPSGDYMPRYSDGRPMFTDERGKGLTARQAEGLLKSLRRRQVARTHIRNGRERICVSTIFLPIDMGFMGEGEKWETMVFGGILDQRQLRYATRAQARAGHRALVMLVQISIAHARAERARRRRMHKSYRAAWA